MTRTEGESRLIGDQDSFLLIDVHRPDGTRASFTPHAGIVGQLLRDEGEGQVFVCLHPTATISAAAQNCFLKRDKTESGIDSHTGMLRPTMTNYGALWFPYAFLKLAQYRI